MVATSGGSDAHDQPVYEPERAVTNTSMETAPQGPVTSSSGFGQSSHTISENPYHTAIPANTANEHANMPANAPAYDSSHPQYPFPAGQPWTANGDGLAPGTNPDNISLQDIESLKSRNSIRRYFGNLGNIGSSLNGITTTFNNNDSEEAAKIEEKAKEDPHHILDTILEDDTDDDSQMIAVDDAMAALDPAVTGMTDTAEIKKRRQGYRENLQRHRRIREGAYGSMVVRFCGQLYKRFLSKTLITRWFVYWLPLALILFIPLAVGAWQNPNLKLGGTRLMWIFIWLEVAWAALFIGRIIAHYIPEVVGFIVLIVVPRYFKFVDAVMALEHAMTLVIWTFVAFISFVPIISDNHNAENKENIKAMPKWQQIINEVLVALLVSALVYFVEQIFIHILSTNFHRTRMAIRIKHQKKAVSVLIVLLDLAYKYFAYGCDEFSTEDATLAVTARATAETKTRLKRNFAKSKAVNRVVGNAYKAVGTAAKLISGGGGPVDPLFKPSVSNTVKDALATHEGCQALGNRIWKSLVMEDSHSLEYDDLLSALGKDRREEVMYMFDILDSDGQDGISLEEMIQSIEDIGAEGRKISKSLVDVNGAIQKLHHLLLCFLLILVVIIFVGMLAPSAGTVLATLGSTLLALSFMFSSTCAEVFSSCVFLFVKHPYDVGDWVQINVTGAGMTRMQVVEMSLLYTVFLESSVANAVRQCSNSILSTLFIDNFSRSGPSMVGINLIVGLPETTMEDLRELEQRINDYVEDNNRLFCPGVWFEITDMTDLDRMTVTICVTTRNSRHDITAFSDRRSQLYEFVMNQVNEIPIHIPRRDDLSHNDPALPLYYVPLSDNKVSRVNDPLARGKRRAMGMVNPDHVKDSSVSDDEAPKDDQNQKTHDTDDTATEKPDHKPTRERRSTGHGPGPGYHYETLMRTQSRMSHMSRAVSTASRQSMASARGLRKANQRVAVAPPASQNPPTNQ